MSIIRRNYAGIRKRMTVMAEAGKRACAIVRSTKGRKDNLCKPGDLTVVGCLDGRDEEGGGGKREKDAQRAKGADMLTYILAS